MPAHVNVPYFRRCPFISVTFSYFIYPEAILEPSIPSHITSTVDSIRFGIIILVCNFRLCIRAFQSAKNSWLHTDTPNYTLFVSNFQMQARKLSARRIFVEFDLTLLHFECVRWIVNQIELLFNAWNAMDKMFCCILFVMLFNKSFHQLCTWMYVYGSKLTVVQWKYTEWILPPREKVEKTVNRKSWEREGEKQRFRHSWAAKHRTERIERSEREKTK